MQGRGRYVDDLKPEGLLHAFVVRSIYAHARILSIDTSAALAVPGVKAVLTAQDAAADGVPNIASPVHFSTTHGPMHTGTPRPVLCGDICRHVGEPVALVVADTAAIAQDAAELVEVAYEQLPAAPRIEDALQPGAPIVWEEFPDNVMLTWRTGREDAVKAAMNSAAHVSRQVIKISRVVAAPLEPRIVTGSVEDGRLVLRTSCQSPHILRNALAINVFKIDPSEIRVIAEDVGGSFGMKTGPYREDVLVLWAARRLARPVRWKSTRSEAFLSDDHARDTHLETELALDEVGNFLAFSVHCDVNVGGYLTARSLSLLRNIGGAAGVYKTPALFAEIRGVFTHSVQTSAYRGAGRPEATYAIERTIDLAAREHGFDPFELRVRNLIPPDEMPFPTDLVYTYDCGDFPGNMKRAAELIDRPGFPARKAAAKSRGKLLGIGFANPIEVAGGPVEKPGKDMSRITAHPDGTFSLECGIMSAGQGLETAMTHIAAVQLGISPDRITYAQGDTDRLPIGRGSGGSSAVAVGGSAVSVVVNLLIEAARERAANLLNVAADTLEFSAAAFRVIGSDRMLTLAEIATVGEQGPDGANHDPRLFAEAEFQSSGVTYPNGSHACEVEIDPETGDVKLMNYAAVEDIGRVINPMLADGQMHGGIAQGFGQAVKEVIIYDVSGELLTGSFSDYGLPLASDLPNLDLDFREIPTSVNPLGAKGIGEAGTVGALSAVMNAVCDALSAVGVTDLEMPATPLRVWSAIQAAENASR